MRDCPSGFFPFPLAGSVGRFRFYSSGLGRPAFLQQQESLPVFFEAAGEEVWGGPGFASLFPDCPIFYAEIRHLAVNQRCLTSAAARAMILGQGIGV